MSRDEIEIPKEIRPFMLDAAQETRLGHKNGANKQYRYGNLHIREYDDKFTVHVDKKDPRKDPLGHILYDAPEIMVGIACGLLGGPKLANFVLKNTNSKPASVMSGIMASAALGFLGYSVTKKIKTILGD